MIIDERLSTFINSMESSNGELLDTIELEALAADVPIIRKDMQSLLKLLLAMKQPRHILEVGCAVGFSAILMAQHNPVDCTVTTIENWPPRIPIARNNIVRAGREEQITLLEGDAELILPRLIEEEKRFDWIFMDAAKGQYPALLPYALSLLELDGVLVTDNVLFDGEIVESRFAVMRRNRTIHKRMREYLYTLTHHKQLISSILPVGDGVAVSVKIGEEHEDT